MSSCSAPKITKSKSKESISVTVFPDFPKFGLEGFDNEFLSLVSRRVMDLAGCNENLKVYLNGQKLHVTSTFRYHRLTPRF
jgi:DNA topoisomerase-2